MPKYIVGYNLPGCIPDEPPFEHDSFEDAKNDLLSHIENYLEAMLSSPTFNYIRNTEHFDEIMRYEHLREVINECYNEEDVPFSVRVGMNNVWIEKSDNTSEEE